MTPFPPGLAPGTSTARAMNTHARSAINTTP